MKTPLPPIVFEAQVVINAEYGGALEQFSSNGIGVVIKELLGNYGEVMAMEAIETPLPLASYRVEFHNTAVVNSVLQNLKGFKIAVGSAPVSTLRKPSLIKLDVYLERRALLYQRELSLFEAC